MKAINGIFAVVKIRRENCWSLLLCWPTGSYVIRGTHMQRCIALTIIL